MKIFVNEKAMMILTMILIFPAVPYISAYHSYKSGDKKTAKKLLIIYTFIFAVIGLTIFAHYYNPETL